MLRMLTTMADLSGALAEPNWDGLYGSLWGNSAALTASIVIGIVLILLVFRFLRKTIMRIVILVLVVAVVGFFAMRVAGDAMTIEDLKNLDLTDVMSVPEEIRNRMGL